MSATNRVLVHVGAPKTGTSFVQDVLWLNRESLAEQGVLYPADRFDEHFLAALDLMQLQWGGLEQQAVGAWDRLAGHVREWRGTAIVSHEILATASRQQVRRALDSFGDAEVHVVLSARDLVRQIPAEWQENLKHRRTLGYRAFLDTITDGRRSSELASWFWGVQEVPDILDRWGGSLPPERVHLVTVPKPGADPGLLWQRFASVFGLDAAALAPDTTRANPSLGVPETALLRRVNRRVNQGVLVGDDYRLFVRELLAHQTLSRRNESAGYASPTTYEPGRSTSPTRGSRSSPRGGTTSSARSTSCDPTRRPGRTSSTPTMPTRPTSPTLRRTPSSGCWRRWPGCTRRRRSCSATSRRPARSSSAPEASGPR